jgi:cation-transporting P-type ATPase E
MLGDGVNDVPALKEARLAIAQGSGTQMARSVSDLVLVRNDFGVVPGMVAEGRQILRNIQRVAQLFVTKSVFAAVLVLAVALPTATFPLLPRQFTIASTVTIGIPAFVLALAPSSGAWRVERCGPAVVMRLEGQGGRRRLAVGGLCAAMLLLFALALVVPILRDFYELAKPTGEVVVAWAVGAALGIGGMLGALRLFPVEGGRTAFGPSS